MTEIKLSFSHPLPSRQAQPFGADRSSPPEVREEGRQRFWKPFISVAIGTEDSRLDNITAERLERYIRQRFAQNLKRHLYEVAEAAPSSGSQEKVAAAERLL